MIRIKATSYSLLDVMMADDTNPMPPKRYTMQLTKMWDALAAIETAPQPTVNHWELCSDAVNLMESLLVMGKFADNDNVVPQAVRAMAEAGKRTNHTGATIRLSGPGINAVRIVLETYVTALRELPERTIIQAHRKTEHRIREIRRGKRLAHDVEVVAL